MTTSLVQASEVSCLAKNIYFEARGEALAGKIAVAIVTLNRVKSNKWPNTICKVVWQHRAFSWTQDNLSDNPKDISAWHDSKYAAELSIDLYNNLESTHYHNLDIRPKWADYSKVSGVLGNHIFYKGIP